MSQQENPHEDRSFEECLQALEKVVERIESGELNLEESLAIFEEGVGLIQSCNRKLSEVERRIEVLTKDSEGRPVCRSWWRMSLRISGDGDRQGPRGTVMPTRKKRRGRNVSTGSWWTRRWLEAARKPTGTSWPERFWWTISP